MRTNGTKKKTTTKFQNGIIPVSTLISMMGKERWNRIIHYINKTYGTRKVALGYHKQGHGAEIYLTTGQHLGNVAKVERLANKKGRKF